ncbi:DUF1456 family protein, partial [Pseudoalteromonas sp. S1731]|uniref:DUF1456 family protein n=1 Tax=Pseudoalteromonas sp. S1731 TaxID=579515 RepID=UPI00110CCC9C
MTYNDILRRVRYTFYLTDTPMVGIIAAAEATVTTEQVVAWLTKEGEQGFVKISDTEFAIFLNGLINTKLCNREGHQTVPDTKLNNKRNFMNLTISI